MATVSVQAYYMWDCPSCGAREESGIEPMTGEEVKCGVCGQTSEVE